MRNECYGYFMKGTTQPMVVQTPDEISRTGVYRLAIWIAVGEDVCFRDICGKEIFQPARTLAPCPGLKFVTAKPVDCNYADGCGCQRIFVWSNNWQ
jgi:hypothetical protein